jgi:prepilin-type processing-associated H-X9-DG protein
MIVFADSEMAGVPDSQLAMIAAAGFTYVPGGYAKGAGWSPIGDVFLFCPPAATAPSGSAPMDPRTFPPRHGNNYNLVCCDGHVEGLRPSLLFSPLANAVRWNNDHQPHPEIWP